MVSFPLLATPLATLGKPPAATFPTILQTKKCKKFSSSQLSSAQSSRRPAKLHIVRTAPTPPSTDNLENEDSWRDPLIAASKDLDRDPQTLVTILDVRIQVKNQWVASDKKCPLAPFSASSDGPEDLAAGATRFPSMVSQDVWLDENSCERAHATRLPLITVKKSLPTGSSVTFEINIANGYAEYSMSEKSSDMVPRPFEFPITVKRALQLLFKIKDLFTDFLKQSWGRICLLLSIKKYPVSPVLVDFISSAVKVTVVIRALLFRGVKGGALQSLYEVAKKNPTFVAAQRFIFVCVLESLFEDALKSPIVKAFVGVNDAPQSQNTEIIDLFAQVLKQYLIEKYSGNPNVAALMVFARVLWYMSR